MTTYLHKYQVMEAPNKVLTQYEEDFINIMIEKGTLNHTTTLNAPNKVLNYDSKIRVCLFMDKLLIKTPKRSAFSKEIMENLCKNGVYEVS